MYCPRVVGSASGTTYFRACNASGTFAANDFVMDDGSTGEIVVATTGSTILGVAYEAATSASTGVLVNVSPGMIVIMDNDNTGTTFAATHVNQYADFTGATAVMRVDTSTHSSTLTQLLCLKYNPQGFDLDSDTSIGKYQVIELYSGA